MAGKIYLIPTTLGTDIWEEVIPNQVAAVARKITHFIVEDVRTARRFLSKFGMENPIDNLQFGLLNEHSTQHEVEELMQPLTKGIDVGLMSEAGVPAVADPGSKIIALAHKKGITVVPLTGPSSIIMAVMGSGLNGQNFAFVGYIPVKSPEKEKRIRQLEQRSREEQQTQFFIEAPYRNNQLLSSLVATLQPNTLLSIACDLTLDTEFVCTRNVNQWKKQMPDLNKRPSIFGVQG